MPAAANPTVGEILTAEPADSVAGRLLQPARYGGMNLDLIEFVAVICELAALDSSRAWGTAMFNAAAHDVATLHGGVADRLWNADPAATVTAACRDVGDLTDDNTLTGRWSAVTGAEFADYLLLPAHRGSVCRVLVPREDANITPVDDAALDAAGVCDVRVSNHDVDRRLVLAGGHDGTGLIAAAGAAVVVGSADGLWHRHVEKMRALLATSYGGEQVSDAAAAQVARSASDIDAAKLQILGALESHDGLAGVVWTCRQAVARARSAADHLLAYSRHALDASDPVAVKWRDVHAGCRWSLQILDGLTAPLR